MCFTWRNSVSPIRQTIIAHVILSLFKVYQPFDWVKKNLAIKYLETKDAQMYGFFHPRKEVEGGRKSESHQIKRLREQVGGGGLPVSSPPLTLPAPSLNFEKVQAAPSVVAGTSFAGFCPESDT